MKHESNSMRCVYVGGEGW